MSEYYSTDRYGRPAGFRGKSGRRAKREAEIGREKDMKAFEDAIKIAQVVFGGMDFVGKAKDLGFKDALKTQFIPEIDVDGVRTQLAPVDVLKEKSRGDKWYNYILPDMRSPGDKYEINPLLENFTGDKGGWSSDQLKTILGDDEFSKWETMGVLEGLGQGVSYKDQMTGNIPRLPGYIAPKGREFIEGLQNFGVDKEGNPFGWDSFQDWIDNPNKFDHLMGSDRDFRGLDTPFAWETSPIEKIEGSEVEEIRDPLNQLIYDLKQKKTDEDVKEWELNKLRASSEKEWEAEHGELYEAASEIRKGISDIDKLEVFEYEKYNPLILQNIFHDAQREDGIPKEDYIIDAFAYLTENPELFEDKKGQWVKQYIEEVYEEVIHPHKDPMQDEYWDALEEKKSLDAFDDDLFGQPSVPKDGPIPIHIDDYRRMEMEGTLQYGIDDYQILDDEDLQQYGLTRQDLYGR